MGGGGSVRGKVLLARLEYLTRRGGPEKVKEALVRLPPADRAVLEGLVLSVLWYPMPLALRLDDAVAAVLSPDDSDRVFLEMGRASADVNLAGADWVMLRPGDPHYLLRMAPQIYAMYYLAGRRTYERVSDSEAILRTYDAESVTRTDCLTVIGWHQRALELAGAVGVEVEERRCRSRGAPFCEYHLRWAKVEGAPPG